METRRTRIREIMGSGPGPDQSGSDFSDVLYLPSECSLEFISKFPEHFWLFSKRGFLCAELLTRHGSPYLRIQSESELYRQTFTDCSGMLAECYDIRNPWSPMTYYIVMCCSYVSHVAW